MRAHRRPAPAPNTALAETLFARLRAATADGDGVTRESYGPGEQAAHEIVRAAAESIGLETATDAAGNLYMTLPGHDRAAPPVLVGSHLDSVKCGGNYDGAAGVVAGLAALAGLRDAGATLPHDVTVMGIRAEESMWFSAAYIGSRAALGQLAANELDGVRRTDSGRTLAEHMRDCDLDPEAVRSGPPHLEAARLGAYYEVHIEQGPTLESRGVPVGIVSGVRGNVRYREATCRGAYGHCGTVPRALRRDAAAAVAELVFRMDHAWEELEAAGHDIAVTFGVLATNPGLHGVSKVAGEVGFAVDVRSTSRDTLALASRRLDAVAADVTARRRVAIALGPRSEAAPAVMNADLRARLRAVADGLGIAALDMPSGAGHDAVTFAAAGVPTAMLFIRNAHGSHNPHEAMALDDFEKAAAVLMTALAKEC